MLKFNKNQKIVLKITTSNNLCKNCKIEQMLALNLGIDTEKIYEGEN